jgi:hypothetical protein
LYSRGKLWHWHTCDDRQLLMVTSLGIYSFKCDEWYLQKIVESISQYKCNCNEDLSTHYTQNPILVYNISLNYNLLKCQEEIFLLMHSCKSSLVSHDSGHHNILLADNDTQD